MERSWSAALPLRAADGHDLRHRFLSVCASIKRFSGVAAVLNASVRVI